MSAVFGTEGKQNRGRQPDLRTVENQPLFCGGVFVCVLSPYLKTRVHVSESQPASLSISATTVPWALKDETQWEQEVGWKRTRQNRERWRCCVDPPLRHDNTDASVGTSHLYLHFLPKVGVFSIDLLTWHSHKQSGQVVMVITGVSCK